MTENEIVAAVRGGDDEPWDHKVLDEDLSINDENIPLNTQNGYSTNPLLADDYDEMYTDRNVLECDVPVMEAFYEQDNVVKDICVDMGVPEKEKTVDRQLSSDVSVEKKSQSLLCDFEDYMTVSDPSKTESPADEEAEGMEFDMQRSLGSFLSRLDDEPKETEQIPIAEQVSEGSKESLTSPDEGAETNSDVLYNRKVETESITFNFESDTEAVESFKKDTEDIQKDGLDHQPQPLITTKDAAKPENSSEDRQAGPAEKHDKNLDEEQAHEESSGKSTSDTHQDSTASKSRSNPFQYDEGEASFSAASLAGFSGPIPYSGSISHRSDASTTSGRSFAFPVLQSEWNSSPVRMAKADRARFRKHKGWRSGLLCCRF